MSSSSRSPLLPPYAMPPLEHVSGASDAHSERSAASMARHPFVPPSFSESGPSHGSAHNEEQDTDLPWIEEFAEQIPQVAASDEQAETWAIDDAGPSIAHIANDLASASAASANNSLGAVPPASAEQTNGQINAYADAKAHAHVPWQDDEAWMDIMPTLPNSGSHDPAMDTSWARAFAEPLAPLTPPPIPAGDTQAAAAALEAVARRLRSGEISVPGFKAESGDAAALAATLSALLTAQD